MLKVNKSKLLSYCITMNSHRATIQKTNSNTQAPKYNDTATSNQLHQGNLLIANNANTPNNKPLLKQQPINAINANNYTCNQRNIVHQGVLKKFKTFFDATYHNLNTIANQPKQLIWNQFEQSFHDPQKLNCFIQSISHTKHSSNHPKQSSITKRRHNTYQKPKIVYSYPSNSKSLTKCFQKSNKKQIKIKMHQKIKQISELLKLGQKFMRQMN